jgi:hypothetical protein
MRFTVCDSCGKKINGHSYLPDETWIAVEANEDADHGQLCSWTCLATWAMTRAIEREVQPAPEEGS